MVERSNAAKCPSAAYHLAGERGLAGLPGSWGHCRDWQVKCARCTHGAWARLVLLQMWACLLMLERCCVLLHQLPPIRQPHVSRTTALHAAMARPVTRQLYHGS
jgi:hypothetical protein